MLKNKLLILIFFFVIAINNLKAEQGDLEKLYRAVSKELDVGTYEDFKAKMQTVADRKRFYEMISEQYDLGTYEIYEKRLGYLSKDTLSREFLTREDYLKLLWNSFAKANGDFDNYEEFKSFMSNHNARRVFYEQATDQGYELGSYEVYERRVRGGMILLGDPRKKMYDVLVAPDVNLYSGDYESFQKKYSTPQHIEELFVILSSQELYTRSFDSFKVQYFPEFFPEELKQILQDYVETANSGKYPNWDELHKQFPEFKNFDKQVLKDYVATANSGKYSSLDEVNTKFPELFPYLEVGVRDSEAKQKKLSPNINWQIIIWIVIGLILMVLIWYLFKTGIIKKISSYLLNVFHSFTVWFKKNKKTIGVSIAVILTIAIITNPSVNTFKSFLRSKGYPKTKIEHLAGRYANFYIFSIYKYEGESYLGFFGNFIQNSN